PDPLSQRRSAMSRLKSVIGLAPRALALAVVVGLALGPGAVMRRVDEALAASWQALGDGLADRELNAIAQQIDRDRKDTGSIGARREGPSPHLLPLLARRERLAAGVEEGRPPLGTDAGHELARLDASVALLRSAIARADRVLDRARGDLRRREVELIALRAEA